MMGNINWKKLLDQDELGKRLERVAAFHSSPVLISRKLLEIPGETRQTIGKYTLDSYSDVVLTENATVMIPVMLDAASFPHDMGLVNDCDALVLHFRDQYRGIVRVRFQEDALSVSRKKAEVRLDYTAFSEEAFRNVLATTVEMEMIRRTNKHIGKKKAK